jgi:hypothetical protein
MTDRALALAGLVAAVAVVGVAPAVAQTANTTLDEDRLPLASADQQVISGETSLEPGTALEVTVDSKDPENPIFIRPTAYVTENGTFAVAVDMRPLPAGSDYEISVRGDGRTLLERTGTVAACSGNCTDSVPELPDEPASEQTQSDTNGSVEPDEEPPEATTPSFEDHIYLTEPNGTARIVVQMANDSVVAVSIGGPETGYQVNATARDGNGDGRVTLVFDAHAAGLSGETLTAGDDADAVTVVPGSEVTRETRIDPVDYDLDIYRGTDVSGVSLYNGSLSVTDLAVERRGQQPPTATPTATAAATPANGGSGPAGAGALAVGGVVGIAGVTLLVRSFLS